MQWLNITFKAKWCGITLAFRLVIWAGGRSWGKKVKRRDEVES